VAIVWGFVAVYAVQSISAVMSVTGLAQKLELRQLTASYTTQDIMKMAVLIAIGGIFKGEWGKIRMILEPLGPFAALVIAPGFYMWGTLGAYLIRKPLSGTISMTLGGIVEILLGNPYGLPVLIFNAYEGFGPDMGYTIFKFKKYTVWTAIIGCLIGAVFGVFYAGFTTGFQFLSDQAQLLQRILGFGGAALGGVIGHYLAKALERVGVTQPSELVIEED
jgi:energy-coupling factor transport system substrate-specific component